MTTRRENTIFGGGAISTGNQNQTNNAIGDENTQKNVSVRTAAPGPAPWAQLAQELSRIRTLLAGSSGGSVAATDRQDALDSVIDTERELSALDDASPGARRSMRLRIKGLIGILAPVAEIIGSVAGLEAIWQHL